MYWLYIFLAGVLWLLATVMTGLTRLFVNLTEATMTSAERLTASSRSCAITAQRLMRG